MIGNSCLAYMFYEKKRNFNLLSLVAIVPSMFEPVVRRWVDSLWDLSLSRHRDRLSWGIPMYNVVMCLL